MQRQSLFDKPMDKLREAFVRARFAEHATFGRADILEWLANPEWVGTLDFDAAPAFLRHFEEAWREVHLGTELQFLATPHERVPEWMRDRVSDWLNYSTILDAIKAGGGKTFYPWANDTACFPVVMITGLLFRIVDGANAVEFQTANVLDVFEVAKAEIKGCRPHADRARTLLNRMARHAVATVRKHAERDFDEAVAVSADGTKIVKADWVVVGAPEGRDRNRATLYPAAAFQAHKALLPRQGHERFNFNAALPKTTDKDVDGLVRTVSARNDVYGGRGMLDLHGTPHGNVLFVHEAFCPSPLPGGGLVIRA